MTTTFYKSIRPDGKDFWTKTIDYASALGGFVAVPAVDHPKCGTSDVLHAAATPIDALTGGYWPFRLFEVEGEPVAQSGLHYGFFKLSVIREVENHLALGPQGKEVIALIERAQTLTQDELKEMDAVWTTLSHTAWDYAWAVSDRDFASDTVGCAVTNIKHDAPWDARYVSVIDAGLALIVRDLIGKGEFTQEHYDTLSRPWRTVVGPLHPDDAKMDL